MGHAHAHAECQECREGASILHEPVHQSPTVTDGFAYRGRRLLPAVVVPEARECLTVEGFHGDGDDSIGLVCVSSDGDILLARPRSGQDSDRDPVSFMPPHITPPPRGPLPLN